MPRPGPHAAMVALMLGALGGCTLNDPDASFAHNEVETAHGAFDGRYLATTRGAADNDTRCGMTQGTMALHVMGGEMWAGRRHANNALSGEIDADGRFELHDLNAARTVSGTIIGTTLTGTETVGAAAAQGQHEAASCVFTLNAARDTPRIRGTARNGP